MSDIKCPWCDIAMKKAARVLRATCEGCGAYYEHIPKKAKIPMIKEGA